jgi:hypothetical protein
MEQTYLKFWNTFSQRYAHILAFILVACGFLIIIIGSKPDKITPRIPIVIEETSPFHRWRSLEYCRTRFEQINESDRSKWTFEFDKELEMILDYIRCGVPFAFARMGDGEYGLIKGKPITAIVS